MKNEEQSIEKQEGNGVLPCVSNRTYKGWLTVDKDGTECWHEDEPEKEIVHWDGNTGKHKKLKKGTIAKLGLNVRWEDEEPLKVNWSPYGG